MDVVIPVRISVLYVPSFDRIDPKYLKLNFLQRFVVHGDAAFFYVQIHCIDAGSFNDFVCRQDMQFTATARHKVILSVKCRLKTALILSRNRLKTDGESGKPCLTPIDGWKSATWLLKRTALAAWS